MVPVCHCLSLSISWKREGGREGGSGETKREYEALSNPLQVHSTSKVCCGEGHMRGCPDYIDNMVLCTPKRSLILQPCLFKESGLNHSHSVLLGWSVCGVLTEAAS